METQQVRTLFSADDVQRLLEELAQTIVDRHHAPGDLALVGIRTGGGHLALRLRDQIAKLCGQAPKTGVIDITLYRDDWTRLHSRPKVGKTEIDFTIDERVVILVDDVIYTGRTIRAAMDALIDFGRPRRIELLVLVDRGQRELPIQPDFVGERLVPQQGQMIDVLLTEQGHAQDAVVVRPA